MKDEQPIWEFYGFESKQEGCPVQRWFNNLDTDAQLEVINCVSYLRTLPSGRWVRPDFDPLDGEGGISEVRPRDVRTNQGNTTYRIYGFRGHPARYAYTFLHGTDKDVKNDVAGKGIAKGRLYQLFYQDGMVHKFDFEGEPVEETEREQGNQE